MSIFCAPKDAANKLSLTLALLRGALIIVLHNSGLITQASGTNGLFLLAGLRGTERPGPLRQYDQLPW